LARRDKSDRLKIQCHDPGSAEKFWFLEQSKFEPSVLKILDTEDGV
jgi:hypothetical protein